MNLTLRVDTPSDWAEFALSDFNAFLLDHAACERKASTVGMSFVVRYPDRKEILEPMINFAREELEHFHQVFKLIQERNLTLTNDQEDPYVTDILKQVRNGRDERFLDRLITSAVMEARGAERMELVGKALPESDLKQFYLRLARAEVSHQGLFLKLASLYFSETEIASRLDYFLELEAKTISSLPYRASLH